MKQTNTNVKAKKFSTQKIRILTVTAILGAVAAVLQLLEFAIPIVPSFIKMDFSDFPALLASFALGPWSGVGVCLIKNLVKLLTTSSAGVGELSNFLLGCLMVVPAGLIYKRKKTRKAALIGTLIGVVCMTGMSLLTNYYIVYPVYAALIMPMDLILQAYQAILPRVTTLWQALLIFNAPFTFVKGMLSVLLTFLTYKSLSPILKSTKH